MAAGLIALPGAIAVVAILLATASPSSGRPAAPAVTGSAGSAACARRNAPVHSTRAGADATVIPPGASAVLMCRYGPRGQRVRERAITSFATVSRLVRELNALPPATGAYSCPSDDGEAITADFSYDSGPENPVNIGLSGCQTVNNGHVTRLGLDRRVIGLAERLVPWQGTITGRLEVCGGPAPGGCHPTSGFTSCVGSRCLHAGRVAITHSIGAQYPNLTLVHGRFAVRVEPGRYRLALVGDGGLGQGRVLDWARARVRANRTTRIAFQLSAP